MREAAGGAIESAGQTGDGSAGASPYQAIKAGGLAEATWLR